MRRLLILPVLTLAFAVGAVPAAGQQIPSPYAFIDTRHSAELFLGLASDARGSLDIGPGGGAYVGARYGIHLGGPFALDAVTFVLPTDRNVYDPREPEEGLEFLGSTSSTVIGLDARVRFTLTGNRTWRGLAPFFMAGGGLAFDASQAGALEEELASPERFSFGPSFMGIAGAGTRWLPTDRLSVRIDGGLQLWRLGTPEAFFEFEGQDGVGSVSEQEWAGVQILTLGVGYRF